MRRQNYAQRKCVKNTAIQTNVTDNSGVNFIFYLRTFAKQSNSLPIRIIAVKGKGKHLYITTSGNCSCSGAVVSQTEQAYTGRRLSLDYYSITDHEGLEG